MRYMNLLIPQGTKQGYIVVEPGGLFDFTFPESRTRRGRVQGGGRIAPTITTEATEICYYENVYEINRRALRQAGVRPQGDELPDESRQGHADS